MIAEASSRRRNSGTGKEREEGREKPRGFCGRGGWPGALVIVYGHASDGKRARGPENGQHIPRETMSGRFDKDKSIGWIFRTILRSFTKKVTEFPRVSRKKENFEESAKIFGYSTKTYENSAKLCKNSAQNINNSYSKSFGWIYEH